MRRAEEKTENKERGKKGDLKREDSSCGGRRKREGEREKNSEKGSGKLLLLQGGIHRDQRAREKNT